MTSPRENGNRPENVSEEPRASAGTSGPAPVRIGVLAIQGSFSHHLRAVESLGYSAERVIKPSHLRDLTHLIIPGGESTTMFKLLTDYGMIDPLCEAFRSGTLRVFGTCAGAILLGNGRLDERPPRLGFASVLVHRNAYGRQVDSFHEEILFDGFSSPFQCVFIRAPRFEEPTTSELRVLGRRQGEPILLAGDRILLASFHPELTQDPRIHRFFIEGSCVEALLLSAARTKQGSTRP